MGAKSVSTHCKLSRVWVDQMAHWIKVLDTKPNDLNLIPGTNMVEGEEIPIGYPPDLYTHAVVTP